MAKPKSKSKVKTGFLQSAGAKFSRTQLVIFAAIFAAIGGYIVFKSFAATPCTTGNTSCYASVNFPPVGIAGSGGTDGYWLVGSDGGVFSQGTAIFHGSAGSNNVRNIVGMATTPDKGGYYLVGSDGGVFAYGDAKYSGGGNQVNHTGAFVGMAVASNGGYWLLDTTGQIYSFGGAPYLGGSPGGYSGNFVGIAASPSGNGYWLATSWGQVYAYGDGLSAGNAVDSNGNPITDIVGITAGQPGKAYYLVGSDGGVFAPNAVGRGAPFYGSGGTYNVHNIVGIDHTADYGGYWLVGSDGGVFAFGDAQFAGRVIAPTPAPTPTPAPAPTPAPTPAPKPATPVSGSTTAAAAQAAAQAADAKAQAAAAAVINAKSPAELAAAQEAQIAADAAAQAANAAAAKAVATPIINSFDANPAAITAGNAATLIWDTSNATSVGLASSTGGSGGVDLSNHTGHVVHPNITTYYSLDVCDTPNNCVAKVISVVVVPKNASTSTILTAVCKANLAAQAVAQSEVGPGEFNQGTVSSNQQTGTCSASGK